MKIKKILKNRKFLFIAVIVVLFSITLVFGGNIVVRDGTLNASGSGNNYFIGNVGIGIPAPNEKLEVDGNITVTSGNDICIGGGNCLSNVSGGGGVWDVSGSDIYYNTGNVGIGTVNPVRRLVIYSSNDNVLAVDSGNLTTGRFSAMDFFHNGQGVWGIGKDRNDNFYIDRFNAPPSAMFIDKNTKNVGIGTASPVARLHVAGNVRINDSDGDTLVLGEQGLGAGQLGFRFDGPATDNQNFVFSGGDASNSWQVDSFTVLSTISLFSGNVGIGTATPSSKLHVVGGSVNASGGLIIEARTSDPAVPATGQIWLRTDI